MRAEHTSNTAKIHRGNSSGPIRILDDPGYKILRLLFNDNLPQFRYTGNHRIINLVAVGNLQMLETSFQVLGHLAKGNVVNCIAFMQANFLHMIASICIQDTAKENHSSEK